MYYPRRIAFLKFEESRKSEKQPSQYAKERGLLRCFQLIPRGLKNKKRKGRSSDLLQTFERPSHSRLNSGKRYCPKSVLELTAAGLSGIFTRFPFNRYPERVREPNTLQR